MGPRARTAPAAPRSAPPPSSTLSLDLVAGDHVDADIAGSGATRSCTTEPRVSSNHRERVDLPMMIWVMLLLMGEKNDVIGDAAAPAGESVTGSAPGDLREPQRVGQPVALFVI